MPQLAKGGKWVFGWVTVAADRSIVVPGQAWEEYGFAPGAAALLLRGSTTSGGFALGSEKRMPARLLGRALGATVFEPGFRVRLPEAVAVHPTQRLLAVRGSGHALSLLTQGPICEMAETHQLTANTQASDP
jgi:hypothetical protein